MLTLAAIDIGSNALRLAIANAAPVGSLRPIGLWREPVRLGRDVFTHGVLTDETIERAANAFRRFREHMDAHHADEVRAVGTSALREALNRDALLERIARESDIGVKVISAEEEARLLFLAVADKVDLVSCTAVLFDIGGGSIEITIAVGGAFTATKSLKLGTVRMLPLLQDGAAGRRRFHRLLEESMLAINEWVGRHTGGHPVDRLVGTGGNMEAIADVATALHKRQPRSVLPAYLLDNVVETLKRSSPSSLRRQFSLRPDRVDVIMPAALVSQALIGAIGVQDIDVPRVGLKDGLLLEMAAASASKTENAHLRLQDMIDRLGQKYHYDEAHARNTASFAAQIFKDTQDLHRLDNDAAILLDVAARLHDIGRFISVSDHHKHSYYLLKAELLEGLTEEQRDIVACVVRYHRKASPSPDHAGYAALPPKDRAAVAKLAAILRLADGLDAQLSGKVRGVAARIGKSQVLLRVQGKGDLLMEKWVLLQKAALFKEVFGRKIVVEEGKGE